VLDRSLVSDAGILKIAGRALCGGASAIQFRDKAGGVRDSVRLARRIKRICARYDAPFIVNDRLEVAIASGADGLHVGSSDVRPRTARKVLGRGKMLGVSAGNLAEAKIAKAAGADYIGVGPLFRTPFKEGERPISSKAIGRIKKLGLPIILIGGIDIKNAKALAAKGFRGIAVIRAIMKSPDPRRAAKRLREVISA
jgi:thiamine-phosphate pyrophosphorylase